VIVRICVLVCAEQELELEPERVIGADSLAIVVVVLHSDLENSVGYHVKFGDHRVRSRRPPRRTPPVPTVMWGIKPRIVPGLPRAFDRRPGAFVGVRRDRTRGRRQISHGIRRVLQFRCSTNYDNRKGNRHRSLASGPVRVLLGAHAAHKSNVV